MKYFLCALLFPLSLLAQTCEHDASVHAQLVRVEFLGIQNVDASVTSALAHDLKLWVNDECQMPDEFKEKVRDEFQTFGYLKAEVGHPKVIEIRGTPKLRRFSIQVNVDTGSQYRLGIISFTGNKEFTAAEARAVVPLSEGEIFSVEKMRQGIKGLRDLYCSRGYVNFTPVPNTEIDEERRLINMTFDLDEGAQFRVGKLTLNGLEPFPGAGKKMLEAWQPHEDEVYNCNLWGKLFGGEADFTGTGPVRDPVLKAIIHREVQPDIQVNNQTHIVDFRFDFRDPSVSSYLPRP